MTFKQIEKQFKPKFWNKFNLLNSNELPKDYIEKENDLIYDIKDNRIISYRIICKSNKNNLMFIGEIELDLE